MRAAAFDVAVHSGYGTRDAPQRDMHSRSHTSSRVLGSIVPAGLVTAALAAAACSSSTESAKSPANVESKLNDALARLDDAANGLTELRKQIPDDAATRARCLVVVPSLKKGGLLVGGQTGSGFATCQNAQGWSAPAPVVVSGGTFGAQLGYQQSQVIALVMNDRAEQKLESGSLKIGVDASAAAGPVGAGRGTQVGNSDVLSYSKSSGLFAGATLDGTTIADDNDTSAAMYGPSVSMTSILAGQVPPTQQPEVQRFMTSVRAAFPPSPAVAQQGP